MAKATDDSFLAWLDSRADFSWLVEATDDPFCVRLDGLAGFGLLVAAGDGEGRCCYCCSMLLSLRSVENFC